MEVNNTQESCLYANNLESLTTRRLRFQSCHFRQNRCHLKWSPFEDRAQFRFSPCLVYLSLKLLSHKWRWYIWGSLMYFIQIFGKALKRRKSWPSRWLRRRRRIKRAVKVSREVNLWGCTHHHCHIMFGCNLITCLWCRSSLICIHFNARLANKPYLQLRFNWVQIGC